jgi:two-component system, OmpR family, response regulator
VSTLTPPPDVYEHVEPHTCGHLRLLTVGTVEANLDGKQLRVGGVVVPLPLKEFELLVALMDNAGRIMTRHELLETVWHGASSRSKNVDYHIRALREHIGSHPEAFRRLRTVRGIGYVFDQD